MIKFSKLLLATVLVAGSAFAQPEVKKEKVPNDWYQLDAATTGYQGISLDKAYSLLQSKKIKSNRIVVAVIDTGIDTLHEDLKSVLWTNPKEIPGNGIDDDRNGYIDDVHGWNFIGGKDGRNLKEDSYEAARVYHKLKLKWEEKTSADAFTDKDKTEFAEYQRAKQKIVGDLDPVQSKMMASMFVKLSAGDTIIRKAINKEEYTIKDMEVYQPQDLNAKAAKSILVNISKANNSTDITNKQLLDELNDEIRKIESASKPPEEYRRNIVQDDENNINDIHYGNND
ncbi:MAG: peptidase S8, partial [Ferruginibacter sp.]